MHAFKLTSPKVSISVRFAMQKEFRSVLTVVYPFIRGGGGGGGDLAFHEGS